MPLLGDGQTFERYQIIRGLGNGVAGESYEAEDRVLQRKVALKLIHPWTTLSDPARRQFFREMQGISTLHHPYLATVLDYGESEGYLYVARRYISSGSLLGSSGRTWFRPPLPVASAFAYVHQLAQILQYIHQHGYVHGALTFANVLILRGPNGGQEPDSVPFLLADPGLAHFVRRFGSPRIESLPVSAAPEQMGKRVTPASDQFALAVLLYFWLAGRPPYLGTPDEVEHLKLTEKITPLSTLNPGVMEEHDNIILRALRAYPEERYPSALVFAEALLASLNAPTQTQSRSGDLGSERSETPRLATTRPLPSLRKIPPLRPATEPVEEPSNAAQPVSEQGTSRSESGLSATPVGALDVALPETPLPDDDEATQPALASRNTSPASARIPDLTTPAPSPAISVEEAAQASSVAENAMQSQQQPGSNSAQELVLESSAAGRESTNPSVAEPAPETPAGVASSAAENATSTASSAEPVAPQTDQHGDVRQPANGTVQPDHEEATAKRAALLTDVQQVVDETGLSASTDQPASAGQPVDEAVSPISQDVSVPRLIITSPYARRPLTFLLTGEATNIGRASANDLVLDGDNLTSRYHALFKRAESRTLVFDKHSNNGVFVNGQRIEPAQDYALEDGDHIGIGSYELIFRAVQARHIAQLI